MADETKFKVTHKYNGELISCCIDHEGLDI